MRDLFVATQLALGPSYPHERDAAMTAYQLLVLDFWKAAGVKDLDDRSHRKLMLEWYFMWEASERDGP